MHLSTSKGEPTVLKAGNAICFEVDSQCVLFVPRLGDGSRLTWPNGDSKRFFPFLKTESDFSLFAESIAITHDLDIRPEKRRLFGLVYVFVSSSKE